MSERQISEERTLNTSTGGTNFGKEFFNRKLERRQTLTKTNFWSTIKDIEVLLKRFNLE